jgi:hypothetical protein
MVSGGIALAELRIAVAGTAGNSQKEEQGNDMSHAMVPEYPIREKICLECWRNLTNSPDIVNKTTG